MLKQTLRGELQLRTAPRNSDMRVAVQDGNYVDHLDVWLQRSGLIGKQVQITVKEMKRKPYKYSG